MEGVNCKCAVCGKEYRITKQMARSGLIGYGVDLELEPNREGLPEISVKIDLESKEDFCPECAKKALFKAVMKIDFRNANFILS